MHFEKGELYHVYNRGHNRNPIFFTKENYYFFLEKAKKFLLPHCDILSYCLMPNHFHFLIRVKPDYPDAYFQKLEHVSCRNPFLEFPDQILNHHIGVMLRSYTRAVNKRQDRIGSLFQEKTKAKPLAGMKFAERIGQENAASALLTVWEYIHNNPVTSGLVEQQIEWEFSSARDYSPTAKQSLANTRLFQALLQSPTDSGDYSSIQGLG